MSARTAPSAAQRRVLLGSPAGFIACGFGSGLGRVAQGTCGSLAAIVPWLALRALPPAAYALALVAGFALGVWACGAAGRALGVADHRSIVWDEFIGQWLALMPLVLWPAASAPALAASVLAGFALFRVFDVWKPWPISWLDRRITGGLGVMLDDVAAGAAAAIVLGVSMKTGVLP